MIRVMRIICLLVVELGVPLFVDDEFGEDGEPNYIDT